MRATRASTRRLFSASLLAAATLVIAPTAAGAAVAPLAATLETGSFAEFSQTNVAEGELGLSGERAYDGAVSAQATYAGGGGNGYSRGIWEVQWHDGEEVWFGAAYYLPVGFHSKVQGQVDLLRWDNWASHPSDTDWGGVSIYGSDRRARLLRFGDGRANDTLVGPLDLPEGRWFTLEVHQRLSGGAGALSELYVDGQLVGGSNRPNTYGRGIERVRYGIVAIAEGDQQKPLGLWFDRATAGPDPTSAPIASASRSPRRAADRCVTRRRAGRRGAVSLRRIAVVCRGAERYCRTVRVRSRGPRGNSLRRVRTCATRGRVCRARSRVVRRHGRRPERVQRRSCRVRA